MPVWGRKFGAALGIIAVAASLYLPVHITRYVVAAAIDSLVGAAGATLCHAEIPGPDRDGNAGTPNRRDPGGAQHHDTACPLCATASAIAGGILPPAPAALRAPDSVAPAIPPDPAAPLRALALHTPYAARAPPPASA